MYIHIIDMPATANKQSHQAPVLKLPCACANLRRASRTVTQLYDSTLRPLGMTSSQLTFLRVLAGQSPMRQGTLGKMLALDSTTVTRSLRPLKAKGWIEVCAGDDRRERLLHLTAHGARQLDLGNREWARAQKRLEKLLGKKQWTELLDLTHRVAALTRAE